MSNINAMATAVTGLKAQAKALENISGNIANSQTAGYKKVDTSFSDLIADAGVKNVRSGAVGAYGRSSNTLGGDALRSDNPTSLSIAGEGFFPVSDAQGRMLYTRLGDFSLTLDPKSGDRYLVNGSGYRLMDVQYRTGDEGGIASSKIVTIPNTPLAPRKTSQFEYKLNLPQFPMTASYDPTVPNSELLNTGALANGAGEASLVTLPYGYAGGDLARNSINTGEYVTVSFDGQSRTYVFDTGEATPPTVTPPSVLIDATGTNDAMIEQIVADMRANLPGAENAEAYLDDNLNLIIKMSAANAGTLSLTSDFGGVTISLPSTPINGPVQQIVGTDAQRFISQSVGGGTLTAYSETGEAIPVQLRWAKLQGAPNEQWSLFYETNSTANGAQAAWQKVGDYTFRNGQMTAMKDAGGAVSSNGEILVNALSVDGVNFGNLRFIHGTDGITQYADASGRPVTSVAQQDGYAKGEFVGVSVDDSGTIHATYSNGKTQELGAVRLALFRSPDSLQRVDGQAFEATLASGEPRKSSTSIMAGWLESSNVEISDEFAKLIVTQQAYSANTKIVTASDEMERELLNLIR
ncbi:MAG: flagellar hook-basal body complex protein [Devosia sp.]|nr:flagellar hook-basal body complex protein [Devosia sp.]